MKFRIQLRTLIRPFLLAGILALFPVAFYGQQISLTGTVSDSMGALSGVTVQLETSTGATRSTTTGGSGQYGFTGLSAGAYKATFFRQGFEAESRTVTLSSETTTLDVSLKVGAVATTVNVTGVGDRATGSLMGVSDLELPVQVGTIPVQTLQAQGTNDLVTALRNVSGVSAQRFYGLYEYYTIRGFNQRDVQVVDGMRLEGNRINTQLNNVQEVDVLKGPSSIVYGGSALAGTINIIRKKPQADRAYELFYKGGRFNTHQVGGAATGPIIEDKLLYRVDTSFDHTDGWRSAGAKRFSLSPSLTWLINDKTRVTLNETFNRDRFSGDGGLPVSVAGIPGFDLSTRLSTPSDFGLVQDSQTQIQFNTQLTPSWELRDGFLYRWTNDEYFVTEQLYDFDPTTNLVQRYALYFKHHRRPIQNQADVVGRAKVLGMKHTLLAGYEYRDFYNWTNRTQDGGDFFPTPINVYTRQETQPPITSFPIASRDYSSNRINAFYWQDQVSLTEKLSLNVGGRFDDYQRLRRTDPWANGSALRRGADTEVNQNAYTYRAGLVYALPRSQQIYFSSGSSFDPVNTIPATGPDLKPETGRSYEVGHRWQGMHGTLQTSIAWYHLERNNVVISRGAGRFDQAGQQSSNGIDFDLKGNLGHGINLIANYGYVVPRFDNFVESGVNLSGFRPRFVPLHTANLWLTKQWKSGITTSIGSQTLGSVYADNADTIRLGGWTTFRGAVGYTRPRWEFNLNAENLFNRQRYFTGADYSDQVYPGSPINVFATVRLRFK